MEYGKTEVNKTRMIIPLQLTDAARSKNQNLGPKSVSKGEINVTDLTPICRIYFKYQKNPTDRLNQLLKQWQMLEEFKVWLFFNN